MISTADLIDSLAAGVTPVPRAFASRRLGLGLAVGVAVAAVATFIAWGPRPDFTTALETASFWVKFAFSGLLAAAGIVAAWRLARPDLSARRSVFIVAATVLAMAVLAAAELAATPEAAHRQLVMGGTAAVCPWLIMLLALPILAGALWAMRALAPTRLAWAGAAAGLAAGGLAAFVYAVSCGETGMPFVLIWYGLGMAIPTLLGALLGPRLLRW
ncbi:NrsF family protein [Chelatococcus reniformis]|uniref:Membrane protein n=1 Tax=Chelatococcus reniformis TaxID=1494448 RepID=A0A916TW76_9HYPH|nr:DUF1109 domain-containing protein [Chelatococcus reniformis]GGC45726.1 membrane protein [Chelatococcus reniformis]